MNLLLLLFGICMCYTDRSIQEALDPFDGRLLEPLLVPRTPGSDSSRKVRNFIGDHFKDLGWAVEYENFTADTPVGKVEMSNVVVRNPSPMSKGTKYTLAAHYDSKVEPEGFIGAIDSAVPVALLMWVAEVLQDHDLDVDFVFFDGEEAYEQWSHDDSIYGAKYHAESDHKINLLVLLDLIGASGPPIPSWFPETYDVHKQLVRLNEKLAQQRKVKHYLVQGELHRLSGMMEDDHIPFLRKGIKCLHLIPASFPPVWHTLEDDAEHLDYEFIREWAILLTEWLKEDLPQRDEL